MQPWGAWVSSVKLRATPAFAIAGRIGGQDGDRMDAVGRAIGCQSRGQAEGRPSASVEREVLWCAAVNAELRTRHTRQVVQYLAADP